MADHRLSGPSRAWLSARVTAGDAPGEDAYVERLITAHRERAERKAAFDTAIAEGFASGFVKADIDAVFANIRRRGPQSLSF